MNTLPNFFLIGAGKSGTTSIYHALQQHPEIYMSPIKEPNFFALEGESKVTGYDEEDPEGFHFYPWAVTEWDEYLKLFEGSEQFPARGEASTMYQYGAKAPAGIHKRIPDAKLIAIFRQPAERLYSRYLHLLREDRTPTEKFEDCLIEGNIWWQKNDLIQEGFYYRHMKRYFDLFPKNQIKIFLYEDLRAQPEAMMAELFEFLEIDASVEIDMSMQHNPSGKIKNRWIDFWIGQNSALKKGINKVSPWILDKIKASKQAQKLLLNLRKKNLDRPKLSPEFKEILTNEVYREDIIKFQDLIDRDLSQWRSFSASAV